MEYTTVTKTKEEQTAEASKYPQGRFNPKPCRNCSKDFQPNAPSEHYCSDECKDRGWRNSYFKRIYGITASDYEKMYADQDGKCAICKGEGFVMATHHRIRLVVDHCHESGVIRGLLCHNCNRALGLLKDDVSRLETAIEYLKVQRLSERSTPEANAGGSAQPLDRG